jgi:hypothetical protein
MGYVVGAILGGAGGLLASPASPKAAIAVGAVVGVAGTAVTEAILAGVSTNLNVWGIGPYTDDSRICRAAVHAGVIPSAGGPIEVQAVGGQSQYEGSSRNGVTTQAYGSWPGSFAVRRPR